MREDARPLTKSPNGFGPIELVVLQGTPLCNLNCSYCYLTEATRKNNKSLSLASIDTIFRKILGGAFIGKRLEVSWHSGEPLLLNPSYYETAFERISQLKEELCGQNVELRFDMQTNGTLINQEWCDFFKRYQDTLYIGVSCDGPAFLHDAYRKTWAGGPTHQRVTKALKLLCENDIRFNLIGVVSPAALEYPDQFFDFFYAYRDHLTEFRFNFLDESNHRNLDLAYGKKDYERHYRFLRALLDRLKQADDASAFTIKNFSDFYRKLFGSHQVRQLYSARAMSHPFKTLNVDVDGNVSTFYAGLALDEHENVYGDGQGLIIGNILTETLDEITQSKKLARIVEDFETSHNACESVCNYYSLCSGGYDLIKYKTFGRFDVTETPECYIQIKTFANALLDDIQEHISD